MQMRITQNLSALSAKNQVSQAYGRLFQSQLLVSRGKKISTPSDDPNSIARLLFFRERHGELEQFEKNSAESRAFVDSASSNLQNASELIQQARESAVQGLNGTLSQTDRETIALKLDGLIQDLVSLGNSKVGNRFLFAGTKTDTQPFVLTTDGSSQSRVEYRGNDQRLSAEIGPGVRSNINLPGTSAFFRNDRGATKISGPTGAKSGLGTDSGVGVDKLVVSQTGTALGGGSGLALGTSSASKDTIIGSHSIQIDVVAGTISLNGGTPVLFERTETDLALSGPNGELIHLDTTGIPDGFIGKEAATGTGTLSIDGGATSTLIDFSTNQQLIDSYTGKTINIDSAGISRAGTDDVSFTGTHDLFQSLIAMRDGLREVDDKGNNTNAIDVIRGHLNELDGAHDQLLEALGELGGISNRLSTAEDRILDLDVRLQELISKTEDVDISDAIIQLQQNETSYQSALLVTSRINNLSLLNFL